VTERNALFRAKAFFALAGFGLLTMGSWAQGSAGVAIAPAIANSANANSNDISVVKYLDTPATTPATAAATAPATAPTSAPAEPDRRADLGPAPIDDPPFPMTDWTGCDPVIGTKDTNSPWPLETAIAGTGFGNWLTANRIRVYGWVDVGGNISSSKQSNSADSYDYIPNQVVVDQAVFRVQRILDTVQNDHFDWGFLFTNLYGTDYRYTTAKGYLSAQYLTHNREYGYDFPECYAELFFPHVFEGSVVKIGRYISPADIEAQLAPQNYIYSHSDTFTYDPYTYTGVNTVTKLSAEWALELGVHFGNDMAPWTDSSQLNGLCMIDWKNQTDAFYGGLNSIGAGKYKHGHDDLQQFVTTYAHKFNENVHMQTEAYYMWMFNALSDGTVINPASETFPAAPSNGPGARIAGRADEWGFVNYFEVKMTSADYLTIRTDFFDDMKGQRTGNRTLYYTETLAWCHNFSANLQFRPEIRYDHSFSVPGYDNGTRKNQVTVAADFVIWF
jgi:hypothetical protein